MITENDPMIPRKVDLEKKIAAYLERINNRPQRWN